MVQNLFRTNQRLLFLEPSIVWRKRMVWGQWPVHALWCPKNLSWNSGSFSYSQTRQPGARIWVLCVWFTASEKGLHDAILDRDYRPISGVCPLHLGDFCSSRVLNVSDFQYYLNPLSRALHFSSFFPMKSHLWKVPYQEDLLREVFKWKWASELTCALPFKILRPLSVTHPGGCF